MAFAIWEYWRVYWDNFQNRNQEDFVSATTFSVEIEIEIIPRNLMGCIQ